MDSSGRSCLQILSHALALGFSPGAAYSLQTKWNETKVNYNTATTLKLHIVSHRQVRVIMVVVNINTYFSPYPTYLN